MTHICVSDIIFIGSDNGLSPCRRQAIIWTNAGILLIGPLGTNFSEILIEILTFSFKKMRLNVLSAKRRPFCLGLKNSKTQHIANNVYRFLGYTIYVIQKYWLTSQTIVTFLAQNWTYHESIALAHLSIFHVEYDYITLINLFCCQATSSVIIESSATVYPWGDIKS